MRRLNQLRALRTRAAISVPDLAKEIGVKSVTVYAWEAGRNALPAAVGKQILKVLATKGVQSTLDELFETPATPNHPAETRAA